MCKETFTWWRIEFFHVFTGGRTFCKFSTEDLAYAWSYVQAVRFPWETAVITRCEE